MQDATTRPPPERLAGRDPALSPGRARYWRRTLRLTAWLLLGWLGVTLMVGLWLPGHDGSLLGWPIAYWAASQGALLMYGALVWLYCHLMDRLEQREEGGPPA